MRSYAIGRALLTAVAVALSLSVPLAGQRPVPLGHAWSPDSGLLLRGTVVTMDGHRRIIEDGRVLVRQQRIVSVWSGRRAPVGVDLTGAVEIDLGSDTLIFPGLINLHDHPVFDVLPLWMPPATHAQGDRGRPTGTEPYANRYQWNVVSDTSPPEYRRLVDTPITVLTSPLGLNLQADVIRYAEVRQLLGGQTATQGAPDGAAWDSILARNVDSVNFGRDRIESRVPSIASLTGSALNGLLTRLAAGQVDAWLVHLAEGVRDGERRPGDTTSSRGEFVTLRQRGLLTDATVILHGAGLEAADFQAMATAPSPRADGTGDRLGAKLVWSPLSNVLLYGRTTNVYEAMAAGVLVSLGTDWTPSGSPHLLTELKIADRVLRSSWLLGGSRSLVDEIALDGRTRRQQEEAEAALDRRLVEMVTINPATTLRWNGEVGSIEPGKFADLVVLRTPRPFRSWQAPRTPYRGLIDATEDDVELVLVGGEPTAGTARLLEMLKPGDSERIVRPWGDKAIDVTPVGVSPGTDTLATIVTRLSDALRAFGGDRPTAERGPAPLSTTYSYLKARIPGATALTDQQFLAAFVLPLVGLTSDGRINGEAIALPPLVASDDEWFFDVLDGRVPALTRPELMATPYLPYRGNTNHVVPAGNPLLRLDHPRPRPR